MVTRRCFGANQIRAMSLEVDAAAKAAASGYGSKCDIMMEGTYTSKFALLSFLLFYLVYVSYCIILG